MSTADRRLLIAGGCLAFVLIAATVLLAPAVEQPSVPAPSSYSSGKGGAMAAYLLLLDLGYPVHRWEQSPSGFVNFDAGTLLILAGPTQSPTGKERQALRAFVLGGGRVLFCGSSIDKFFPQAKVLATDGSDTKEFTANLPGYLTRDAERIQMRPEAYWGRQRGAEYEVYGGDGQAVVVAWNLGHGQVLWWAGSTPLTNEGIGQSGNLALLLNAVNPRPGEERKSIYWDEYFHGERGSLWSYVEKTPVVWGLLQLALFSVALIFTFSRRSGPVAMPAVRSRLAPLEFVDTMGGLYRRAGASSIPVAVTYRRLRLELTRRLGLASSTGDAELAAESSARLGIAGGALSDLLSQAQRASAENTLRPRAALSLVQDMEEYIMKLEKN